MQSFAFFAVLAAAFFAFASILSKHLLTVEVDDHVFTGSIFSWPFFLLFIAVGLARGELVTDIAFVFASAGAGALYALILVLYLKGLNKEEASRFIPTIALNTVFLAVLTFIFTGEVFSVTEYLGMSMAVLGAITLSLKDPLHNLKKFSSRKGTGLAVAIAFLIAFRDLALDLATAKYSVWAAFFWMGIGGFAFSLIALLFLRPKKIGLEKILEQKNMIGVGSVRSIGFLMYLISISLGPAAKSSAILKINGLLVFLGATALSYVRPDFVEESRDIRTIIQKLLGALLIVIGVILVR